jgi:type I restriction-modification system DNA methylase subunit/predicted type IV restriction endonuclease
MAAPDAVLELVERFARNRDQYLSPAYNETQVRREFIDPLFTALGWDVENTAGYAQQYKDVVHEDAIKVGLDSRAPDYSFRIGGQRKFFVEAKKPAVNLKDDPAPAYQLRRYAWSAKLPLSLLTDFQELAVYDCRVRPAHTDAASAARTLYVPYESYDDRWEEIASVFAKEAILQGSFDRYAESAKTKKGTAEVDKAFLSEIEIWREALAHNIALRNPSLSQRELNYAVQVTIDRIIFLRICEDRGIEVYGRLRGLVNGRGTYGRLSQLFWEADQRYNSGLFHFADEKGRAGYADKLTPTLMIDDKPLKDILRRLYYPESPYEFSVLPADILGQVYEQFLGKVIRLTAGHRAVVEDKPEVKKAGGVYYTPTYIVDYIVKHTVGRLLEGKTVRQAAELRVLDPACGSGSFLIGAYQYLLDWHLEQYAPQPEKHRKELVQGSHGEWQLATAEKKRILLTNIYGVDIDAQAVETTKLSLLLKVLEGETSATIESQLSFLRERALPDLAANVKCGNSLIGPDFYDDQQIGLAGLGDDERYRLNVFDWRAEFPLILGAAVPEEKRGFDAVIGNPPYVRIQNLKEFAPTEVEFYKRRYASASKGNYDLYVVFVERGLSLLCHFGRLGYILPSKFFATDYGAALRGLLASAQVVDEVVDFGHEQVFEQATTYTCLLFLEATPHRSTGYRRVQPSQLAAGQLPAASAAALPSGTWLFMNDEVASLSARLLAGSTPLLELPTSISRGSSSGDDGVFCLETRNGELRTRDGEAVDLEEELLRRPLWATDFTRYELRPRNEALLIFPYRVSETGYALIPEAELRERWPRTYAYLRAHRTRLEKRRQHNDWYAFSAPRNLHVHARAQLVVPLLADRGLAAPLGSAGRGFCLMASGGFSIRLDAVSAGCHPYYVLGLVNSKLLFWYLRQTSNRFRGGWITCTKQYFGQLPIRVPRADAPAEQAAHDALVTLVRRRIALSAEGTQSLTPDACARCERDLLSLEGRIDAAVAEIYGISQQDIALIEGTAT